jgi:hypothetical protein
MLLLFPHCCRSSQDISTAQAASAVNLACSWVLQHTCCSPAELGSQRLEACTKYAIAGGTCSQGCAVFAAAAAVFHFILDVNLQRSSPRNTAAEHYEQNTF